jgi:hypothetical protein
MILKQFMVKFSFHKTFDDMFSATVATRSSYTLMKLFMVLNLRCMREA